MPDRLPRVRLLAVTCVLSLLAGCGDSETAKSRASEASPASSAAAADRSVPTAQPREPVAPLRDMTIIVRDVVTVPPSSNERPLARINHLIDAGDGSGRLFVNDM